MIDKMLKYRDLSGWGNLLLEAHNLSDHKIRQVGGLKEAEAERIWANEISECYVAPESQRLHGMEKLG